MNVKAAIERKIRVKPPREIQFGGEFGGKGEKGQVMLMLLFSYPLNSPLYSYPTQPQCKKNVR